MAGHIPHYMGPPGYMFPPLAVPPGSRVFGLGASIPAKRESDEVQFVSSNPVKKRRIDERGLLAAPNPPILTTATPSINPNETIIPDNESLSVNTSTAVPCPQPQRMSTIESPSLPSPLTPDLDTPRGCSEPVLNRVDYENMWTAPARGPRSSPALSPKQIPLHISPSLLQLKRNFPNITNATYAPHQIQQLGAPVPLTSNASPLAPAQHIKQQHPDGASVTNGQTSNTLVPELEAQTPSLMEQLRVEGMENMPYATTAIQESRPGEFAQPSASDSRNHGQIFAVKCDLIHQNEKVPGKPTETLGITEPPLDGATSTLTAGSEESNMVATSHHDLGSLPHQSGGQTPNQNRLTNQPNIGTNFVQCKGDAQHSGKGNCLQCLQAAWIRQNGMPPGGAFMTATTTKPQMTSYQAVYPQPWPQNVGMGGYPAQFSAAVPYGQLLRQQLHSSLTVSQQRSQQQSASTGASCPVAPMALMTTTGPSYPPPTTNSFQAPMWNPQASSPVPSAATNSAPPPQTPYNGKHIIVDMAETCLEVFPFEDFARRHNQPAKKIRDIFEAIIQMPLLRCPTDKRRAGKVATAKVKQYTQARKEMQANMGSGSRQGKQQNESHPQGQGAMQQPSAWEMAQYMGPSDVQIPGHLAFPGPW